MIYKPDEIHLGSGSNKVKLKRKGSGNKLRITDASDNVLVNAPHTMNSVIVSDWARTYTREKAVFPVSWLKEQKFWPSVGRIDNAQGDRQLVCTCPPLEAYEKEGSLSRE